MKQLSCECRGVIMTADAKEAKTRGRGEKTSDEFFACYYVRLLLACNLIEFQIRVFSYIFIRSPVLMKQANVHFNVINVSTACRKDKLKLN
jgi:hypothetical protein